VSNQVTYYLQSKGIEFKRRGEELIYCCQFCDDTEFKGSINSISGAWNCFHLNSCGLKGSFYDFQKRMGDKPVSISNENSFITAQKKKKYVLPAQQNLPPMRKGELAAYLYLKGRGFADETISYFKIGAKESVVMFPFYKNGKLVNIKHRDIGDKKKMWQEKDAEPCLFNRDNIEENILVITEGEYDTMALYQYGIEAVSVPTGANGLQWIETEWDYLETFRHIKICFDNDGAGIAGAKALAERLGSWRCSLVELPFKDANACLLNGITAEEIKVFFNNATELAPQTLVTPLYFKDKVLRLFELGTALYGLPTPWEKLNNILKGWRTGELTVWSGRNGAGKSTILNQIIIDIAGRGERSCIYSGEMPPERYLRWAVVQYKKNSYPSPTAAEDSLTWMSGKIFILNISNIITPDKLLSDFEYAARRYGCAHFVIDSLMKINLNENDEYNQQKQFVTRLTDFCMRLNVHVHLVAHPRKTQTDRDEPGKVDIKGSSHITDLAHNVIILNRAEEQQKETQRKKGKTVSDTQLFVKKNREFGAEGMVHLYFNEQTRNFTTESFPEQ